MNVVDSFVSGPSVTNPVYQMNFFPTTDSHYTAHTIHSIINQPEILYMSVSPQCQVFQQPLRWSVYDEWDDLYSGTLPSGLSAEFRICFLRPLPICWFCCFVWEHWASFWRLHDCGVEGRSKCVNLKELGKAAENVSDFKVSVLFWFNSMDLEDSTLSDMIYWKLSFSPGCHYWVSLDFNRDRWQV